jgi:lipoprotein-anchoring transpeptidase ErfK/SrfK
VRWQSSIFVAFLLSGSAGCTRARKEPPTPTPALADASTNTTGAELAAAADAGPDASPAPHGLEIIATQIQAPVYSAPEWPARDPTKAAEERKDVVRLGYLRRGGHAFAKPDVIKKSNCPEDWYELVSGGFVCGKFVTTDPQSKELRNAPHAPYMDRALPYDYGLNLTVGTPLYRRIPLKSERKENERALAIGKGAKASDVAKKLRAQGEAVPKYLEHADEDKPHVGFDDLKGESQLVAEHMLRGFYLALDAKVSGYSGTFWRTTSGLFAPKDHILVHESKTEFEGVHLDAPGEKRKLPLAWVVGTKARQCTVEDKGEKDKKVRRTEHIDRFTILQLTGEHTAVDDRVYYKTDQGFWVRDIDVAVVQTPKVPKEVAPGEKWIDVDLSQESLVAFEGDKPVFATIVSTGRHNTDPAKDHTTVSGSFRIREKHISTTMDDDAASDGTYRIEDVPWVMYFEKSYALHGAFWHSSFGRERSHGCVNLTPHDAREVFLWAGPTLPEGWHAVRATEANPGTRVIVHP